MPFSLQLSNTQKILSSLVAGGCAGIIINHSKAIVNFHLIISFFKAL
jgi:hypothetical protein